MIDDIVNFELRILNREFYDLELGWFIKPILQYRKTFVVREHAECNPVVHINNMTDWIDVPIVAEGG